MLAGTEVPDATTTSPPKAPAVVMGLGLGGFIDGIVLHQILQWHHMLMGENGGEPMATVAGLETNTLVDGFFRLATWILAVAATATWYVAAPQAPNWTVDVTCLAVDGRTAVIGFSGRFVFGGPSPVAGLLRVIDGGGPASGQDSFEWAQIIGEPGGEPIAGPTGCSSYPAGFSPQYRLTTNSTSGDVAVTNTIGPRQQARQECIFIRAAHGRPAFRTWYGTGPDKRYALRNCVNDRSTS